jgi:DNA polymerase-1
MIPFKRAFSIDFEYRADPGERPHIWCLAVRDHATGETKKWWRNGLLLMSQPPFPTDSDTLVYSYAMTAEMSCFKQLGWKPPEYLLDLFAEYRWATNGRLVYFTGADSNFLKKRKNGMLAAAFQLGVPAMASARKEAMRQLAMTRWEFTPEEQVEMMVYCGDDTGIAAGILDRLLHLIDWPRALLRGRYCLAVASVEHEGIPIDVEMWQSLTTNWPFILERLIEDVNRECPVFVKGSLSYALLLAFAAEHGIPWELTPKGKPLLEKEYRDELTALHPELLRNFHELYTTRDQLKLTDLAIGKDGRNRASLKPFTAVTARNAPSSSGYVFGPAKWVRHLIKPEEGWALLYFDVSAEEIGLAAVFSGCGALLTDYLSGDVYIAFAKRADLVPAWATKQTHRDRRELCKTLFLSLNYGRSVEGLAAALGQSMAEAVDLLRRHMRAYPELYSWLESVAHASSSGNWMTSRLGWRRYIGPGSEDCSLRSARNWPCQTAGTEALWLMACRVSEAGYRVCALVHDALLVAVPLSQIAEARIVVPAMMAEMTSIVTGGIPLNIGVEEFRYPGRFIDERGLPMWNKITQLHSPYVPCGS